jgi:hypothetical protein
MWEELEGGKEIEAEGGCDSVGQGVSAIIVG